MEQQAPPPLDEGNADQSVLTLGDLRDESFVILAENFLQPNAGGKLITDDKPCKNKFLVQVGLLKEENHVTWRRTTKWLQTIFPVHHTADFRGLVERGVAAACSLSGEPRGTFLDSDVDFESVGAICDSLCIKRPDLLEMSDFSERAKYTEVTNGLLLELSNFMWREKIDTTALVTWLRNFSGKFCDESKNRRAASYLQLQVKRIKIKISLHLKKGSLQKYLQTKFELPTDSDLGGARGPYRKRKRLFTKYLTNKKQNGQVQGEHFSYSVGDEGLPTAVKLSEKMKKRKCGLKSASSSVLRPYQISNMVTRERDYEPKVEKRRLLKTETIEVTQERSSETKPECVCLLDVAVLCLQKLSSLYSGVTDECQHVSHDLLLTQFTLMMEKDPRLRDFDQSVRKKEHMLLMPPCQFLHCNARFLLELNDALERQFVSFEAEIVSATGERLGRDRNPKFVNFVNFAESATSRYVRMVCNILNPLAKTKHSRKVQWLDYCRRHGKVSKIAVDQSNRFLNYFEGAAAVVHHHGDIIHFFSNMSLYSSSNTNIIQESIVQDARDQFIRALVCVLAIVYCKVLGPYWQLLKSGEKYVKFGKYVQHLYEKLILWSEDASHLLLPEPLSSNIFHQPAIQERNFEEVFHFSKPSPTTLSTALIRKCLEKVMGVIASITKSVLKDFLPGGIYCHDHPFHKSVGPLDFELAHLMGPFPDGPGSSSNWSEPRIKGDASTRYRDDATINRSTDLPRSPQTVRVMVEDMEENGLLSSGSVRSFVNKNGGPCASKQDADHPVIKVEGPDHTQEQKAISSQTDNQKMILGSQDKGHNNIGLSLTDMVSKLKNVLPNSSRVIKVEQPSWDTEDDTMEVHCGDSETVPTRENVETSQSSVSEVNKSSIN